MSAWGKWCSRLSAVLGAAMVSVLIPAMAWASTGPGEMVVEAARRRSRGGFGFLGLLCCLAVVGVVVVVVLLIMRNRKSGPR